MYFSQQSPSVAPKLASHHEPAWSRPHPSLGPQQPIGPLPQSPGYAIYTNGTVSGIHPHHMPPIQHHHHQSSISHFPSPPNGHVLNGSPAASVISPHWQQQLLKCEAIRACRSPFHRARASALAARNTAKSAIPITNPKLPPAERESSPAPVNSDSPANHPSSTAAPVAETPRHTLSKPPESNWNSLDMGGVNIKNLPPTAGLWSFTFLIHLYLNHNALSSVPPQISRLRHLELLDLSGNVLASIPPELGMLTSLKELYLFDNHLTTIPPELGTLHQLQTLGVEGNPLDANLKSMIQKDGTAFLIAYLRDSCPVPQGPPTREWKQLVASTERNTLDSDETFSVLCYNILCEWYATKRLYGYTPSWALSWDYRKSLILEEILNHDSDFLCLQEVDSTQYENFFMKHLEPRGYDGVFWPKSRYKNLSESDRQHVDGCATFFKQTKYQLVEKHLLEFQSIAIQRSDFKKTDDVFNRVFRRDDIATVCLLENKRSGSRLVVANTHIYWDPNFSDVKLLQVALLTEEIEKISNHFAKYPPRLPEHCEGGASTEPAPIYSDGTKIPTVIAGDFNSVPQSGVYEFLTNGSLKGDHPDWMNHSYGRYTEEGIRHKLSLRSAYAGTCNTPDGELPLTNYIPSFSGTLDYVWYSVGSLEVTAVLGEIDQGYLEKVVGFPNALYPSDHICIVSEFRVKPQRPSPTNS